MKRKFSCPAKKKLLCAVIGGSLVWQTPFIACAVGEETQTAAPTEQTEKQDKSDATMEGKYEFNFEGIEVTANRDRKKQEDLPPFYAGGQMARGARLGLLGNVDIMNAPFSITSYTAQTIENQQARTVSEVLANDASVRYTTPNGHMIENYSIRGFFVNSWDLALNGMYGLAPFGHVPTEFLERVEVLKGPSALLYGMPPQGSVGGTINLVPKRAADEPLTRITTDYTSDSQFGTHLDIGRRFGQNNEWGIRFNGVYQDGNTGVSGQSKKRELGAVGLDYRGERWRASLDAYDSKETFTGGSSADVYFSSAVTSLPAAPDSSTNLFRGIWGEIENKGVVARGEYDINDNLTAYAGLGTLRYDYSGYVQSTHAKNVDALGNYSGTTTYNRGYAETVSGEAGLRSCFQTGTVSHQVVLSATSLDIESGSVKSESSKYASNIYNPATPVLAADPGPPSKTAETTLSSVALTDTLSFNQDKYQLTLGVRNQRVRTKNFSSTGAKTSSYDESAVTPAIAFVVKPWAAPVSLYANYIEGLSQGSTVTDTTASNYGHVFAPFKTKQIETGVKWDAGDYAHTLSLFQIIKPSVILDSSTNTYNQDGKQRNRGIEWSVLGKINQNWRILGGVTFLRGVTTHTANGTYDGNTAYGTPKWQSNLGFEWDTPNVPGLTLSARAVYTGAQYANSANTLKMPSWIRYDVGARYVTKIHGKPVTFRLGIENLLDKNYWAGCYTDGYLTTGSGRTFKLSTSIDI
ncbi:TonB-dependent siderophore receptor [Sporomusa sp. KB1]|jgi:iron complex outermembrane receptor protein|uniref:TonB-dependent receptor n=1 Tax=Sporomusa sp. KB1 TaxID=943346 RepID=UPI0011A4A302|nr:TonB-dependent siderophore receptor [Sporomusa sp. KB1]TWH46487.1 iron complex outermembrane receptor protein [Sporomusa sp. KB1]